MSQYITAAVLARYPGAIVKAFQFDGGVMLEVRAEGRHVRVTTYWGDNPDAVVAHIFKQLA